MKTGNFLLKTTLSLSVFSLLFFLTNAALASSQADLLQPASTIKYKEDITVDSTARFNSVHIGNKEDGGVIFAYGTIINPSGEIALGDDVKIYGSLTGMEGHIKIENSLFSWGDSVDIGSTLRPFEDAYFNGDVKVGNIVGSDVIHTDNIATSNNPSSDQVLSYDGESLVWVDQSGGDSGSGGITSIIAGDGLSGGGESGDVTLNVSSVTSSMITNGTITGSDVSSQASLSIGSLNVSGDISTQGDINQSLADNGAVKALVYVESDGSCTRQWTYDNSTISCEDMQGTYLLTFEFNVISRYWSAVVNNDSTGQQGPPAFMGVSTNSNSEYPDMLMVAPFDAAQVGATEVGFMLTVY